MNQTSELKSTGMEIAPVASFQVPALAVAPEADVVVSATTPDEMQQTQIALIAWAVAKVAEARIERDEMGQTVERAMRSKWKVTPLRKALTRAQKRLDFYEKVLGALEHGYCIVPNFPITAFAVRTDRTKPLRFYTTRWDNEHTQDARSLPAGEGEYKNPFPMVRQQTIKPAEATKAEVCGYWASGWKDLEFPVTMAKPRLMEAVDRAMALKIFDEIGVLPGFVSSEGTRPPRGDPMIVATIQHYKKTVGYSGRPDVVTFMVCWQVDTKMI